MAKKLVHWALETLGSPSLPSLKLPGNPEDESTTESTEESSTATLQYVNSQLLAHGFTHGNGLSLEGTSREDAEKVLKCLVAMLGQRMEDMSRTEELSTKIRTLSYDHERLQSMYRTATEKAANAEREANVHKARLATTTRTLATTTASFKSSQAELQRTRTALQSLRATHQAELKKLEKEKDKLLEKVTKLSEHQYVTRVAGIRYANENAISQYNGPGTLGPIPLGTSTSNVVSGSAGDFLEVTLEESMQHRQELADENRALKGLLLRVANEMQHVEFQARCAVADLLTVTEKGAAKELDEPPAFTVVELFPLSPPVPTTASTTVNSLLASLGDSIRSLADPEGRITLHDGLSATMLTNARRSTSEQVELRESGGVPWLGKPVAPKDTEREQERQRHAEETRKLAAEVEKLKSDLEQAQTQASTYAAQIQLTDLSKQVEAMKRPWSIYGTTITTQPTAMDVDPAPSQPPAPAPAPPKVPVASSSKQALNTLFRPPPEPEPQPVAGPSSLAQSAGDDVLAYLPPPSPALSYIDEPQPEPAPVRRSPRKFKPTSPLRLGGTKRKASGGSPEHAQTKKARTQPTKKDAVTESVRGFNAGVGAASSPRSRAKSKAAEKQKEAKSTVAASKAKGKERAVAKPSGAAQAKKPESKSRRAHAATVPDIQNSPKPPTLPAFVLPPPSPASRLPSLKIPSVAGPSSQAASKAQDDADPFSEPAASKTQPAPNPTTAAPSSSKPPAAAPPASAPAPAPPPAPAPAAPSVPQTPSRRIFGGRPIAPHMVHAYSPVKPSPLSRILMLADSPDSPDEPPIPRLDALAEAEEPAEGMDLDMDEEDEDPMDVQVSPTPVRRRQSMLVDVPMEEDGDGYAEEEASDADEVESLIRGKGKGKARARDAPSTKASTRLSARTATKASTSRTRADVAAPKSRTRAKAGSPAKSAVAGAKEKENARRSSPRMRAKTAAHARTRSSSGSTEGDPPKVNFTGSRVIGGGVKKTRASARASAAKAGGAGSSKSATPATVPPLELEDLQPPSDVKLKAGTKLKGRSRAGPRRVPIDSSEAAPAVRAWRG